METVNIEAQVKQVFVDLFQCPLDSINNDSSPRTIPKWDSLQHLNLVLRLEDEFGIRLLDEQVIEMTTFGAVVRAVLAARAAPAGS